MCCRLCCHCRPCRADVLCAVLCMLWCSHAAHAVDCQVVELLTYALNNSKVREMMGTQP